MTTTPAPTDLDTLKALEQAAVRLEATARRWDRAASAGQDTFDRPASHPRQAAAYCRAEAARIRQEVRA